MARGKYEYWLTSDGLLRIEAYARDGLTDEQIAHNMGISTATLYNYKRDHLEILEALKRGKEVVDVQVENALLKRALGYSFNEDKYMSVQMSQAEYYEKLDEYMNKYKYEHPEATDSELIIIREQFPRTKMVLVERKTKDIAPDTTAQIFWLKNRKPKEWRDKQELEHSGEIVNKNVKLTPEELDQEIKKLEKELGVDAGG